MNRTGCHWGRAAVIGGWLWGAAVAFGETTSLPASPALPDASFSVLRVLGALALVLAVFFAGVWVFRNWQRFLGRTGRAPKLAVLEVKQLGNRHSLYVVGYENRRLLLASSPANVSLISPLPDAPADAAAGPVPAGFGEVLQQVLQRKP